MVVEPLGLQHLGKVALVPRGLLELGPLVLEPDLDLVLVEAQLPGEESAPLLGQVTISLQNVYVKMNNNLIFIVVSVKV